MYILHIQLLAKKAQIKQRKGLFKPTGCIMNMQYAKSAVSFKVKIFIILKSVELNFHPLKRKYHTYISNTHVILYT